MPEAVAACARGCHRTPQVPFAKLWSPAFVPKPRDWPAHVRVVGSHTARQRWPLLKRARVPARPPSPPGRLGWTRRVLVVGCSMHSRRSIAAQVSTGGALRGPWGMPSAPASQHLAVYARRLWGVPTASPRLLTASPPLPHRRLPTGDAAARRREQRRLPRAARMARRGASTHLRRLRLDGIRRRRGHGHHTRRRRARRLPRAPPVGILAARRRLRRGQPGRLGHACQDTSGAAVPRLRRRALRACLAAAQGRANPHP